MSRSTWTCPVPSPLRHICTHANKWYTGGQNREPAFPGVWAARFFYPWFKVLSYKYQVPGNQTWIPVRRRISEPSKSIWGENRRICPWWFARCGRRAVAQRDFKQDRKIEVPLKVDSWFFFSLPLLYIYTHSTYINFHFTWLRFQQLLPLKWVFAGWDVCDKQNQSTIIFK